MNEIFEEWKDENDFDNDDVLDFIPQDELFTYVTQQCDLDDFLRYECKEQDLIDVLVDYHDCIVFDSPLALERYVKENYNEIEGINLSSNYHSETLALINEIVKREGWNYLYNILEQQKEKLHLI